MVARNLDLAGGRHEQPLVLLRTVPFADSRRAQTNCEPPANPLR
jgi:hypothetical protein